MARSNAQRQWWDSERRQAQAPRGRSLRRHDRRVRPQRWTEAVETLQELQEQYHEWLQSLSASRHDAALAEKLRAICALDLAQLDVAVP
jgi:hypothetical protein